MAPLQKILVIEDEFLVAIAIASALEQAGFGQVERVDNEPDAYRRIAQEHWDGVIADANLNGQSIGRIAEMLWERSIPLVIVTGCGRQALPTSIRQAPVIEKPFRGSTLAATLNAVLPPRLRTL